MTKHIVEIKGSQFVCSCEESTFDGLPCRHEIAVAIHTSNLTSLAFKPRWTLSYFKIEELNETSESEKTESNDEDEDQVTKIFNLTFNCVKKVLNPTMVKSKGRPHNAREKHPIEKQSKKRKGGNDLKREKSELKVSKKMEKKSA